MTSSENTGSRASYNTPEFTPFQSGCSLCYPSTDYTGTNISMKSGGSVKKAGMHKMPNGSMMKNSKMKSGGKMGKCKYGCN